MLGHFLNFHTDINGISALMIECKNINRGEVIAFGVIGSLILRQSVADIHDGIADEKWRRAVAKLVGTYLRQDVPENLSQPVRNLSLSSRHESRHCVAILKCCRFMEAYRTWN